MAIVEQSVSRHQLLPLLDDAVAEARRRRGTCVVAAGAPGTGKTYALRIASEVFRHDTLVLHARCTATGDTPFGPWQRLLELTRRRRDDDAARPASDASWHLLTPREYVDRLLALWASNDRPVLVLLDDVHAMDPSSHHVLHLLRREIAHEAVVLILALDDESDVLEMAGDDRSGPMVRVAVDGMDHRAIVDLLRSQDPGVSSHLVMSAAERMLADSQGHPLVLTVRLRRLAHRVPSGDIVHTVLAEPPAAPDTSPRMWIQRFVGDLSAAQRDVLARWCLAPTLTRGVFCLATGVTRQELDDALHAAALAGVVESTLAGPSEVPSLVRAVLDASLSPTQRAQTHLQIGRTLLESGPAAVIDAAHHLERAAALVPAGEIVATFDLAADLALRTCSFAEAERLSRLAEALSTDHTGQARRVLLRSRALRGQGQPTEADELAREACALATRHGEADLLAEAAVELAVPPDWRVGSVTTQQWLEAALAAGPSPAWHVRALAGLAHQRFQLPRSRDELHRWSWQFRPELAAELAEDAVQRARLLGDDDALIAALLAWRSVHRQPYHLERRRAISSEALSIAVRRRDTTGMVQGAVRVAVDELESAHREGFEHAVVVARWAADQSTDTRLMWRAHLLEATRAVLDGDLDALERAQGLAVRAGRHAAAPGREVAELILDRHVMALGNGWAVVAALTPEATWPLVHHPLGVAGTAEAMARAGRTDQARRLLHRLRWPADPTTSMLLVTTLAARAAVMCGDDDTARAVLPTLVEYADHVAVDPEALWVEGPVALVGAQVADMLGDRPGATTLTQRAQASNRGLDCARTAAALVDHQRPGGRQVRLPEREHAVLRLLADGLGNAQIARALNFSVSTIRRETTSLYQRLGVANRAGAVAKAHELGLL